MDAMWTHDHSADGLRLRKMCDRGTWIVGARDGFAYLLDLGGGWVAPLLADKGRARMLWSCRLDGWKKGRISGTLSMQVSEPHLGIEEERSVRAHCVDLIEPVHAALSYVRVCWERGLVPPEPLDQISEPAGPLGLELGTR